MRVKRLDISNRKIWRDRTISHISIGRIQSELKSITNIGFRNNLKILEKNKYLVYKEYDIGLYEYHIY